MKVNIRPVKTAAETALADAFAQMKHALPGQGAVGMRREAAFRLFEATGLPSRRVEEWKYTDLRSALREARPLAPPPGASERAEVARAHSPFAGVEARRLVIVNGAFVPELSDLAGLEGGLTIGSLARALAAHDADLVARISVGTPADNDPAMELNTAFMTDGVLIRIADGVELTRPIHVDFHFAGGEAGAVFQRSVVVVGRGARATILESHRGPQACDYQINTAIEFAIGEDARLEHVKVGDDGGEALHVATLTATLGARARLGTFVFSAGGSLTRNQSFVRCDGEGATLRLAGASLLRGHRHVDNTLVIDHAIGGCTSREMFKSVLDDEAKAAFQGKIIVRPDAQKTDARMMSQALLLSDEAEAANKPELEIFADDVQCGHGATAGAIDENLKFYLMARGIPEAQAEALLIEAFVGEAIDGIEHEGVREALMERVRAWLWGRV